MGNGLFLALALGGGGVSQSTLDALMMMRQRNYEKLCLFIKWLTSTLIYGYYWLKKHPAVLDKSGAPDVSGAGTQAFVDAFWKQQDQKDFIANMIRDGADLLMNWLKPDDFESKLWGSMLQHPSPTVQNTQLLSSLQTLLQSVQPSATTPSGTQAPAMNPQAPPGSAANPVVRPRGGNL